jgi:MMP 1-O-methyltransferase
MTETPDFTDLFNHVEGFLSLPEAELLYRLASVIPADGIIVEIGSYRGRSTICLALGAKVNSALVYAIDPHDAYEAEGTHYSAADCQAYYENIAHYGVGDVVRTINLPSTAWLGYASDLLFIDGSHRYEDVEWEFRNFSRRVQPHGLIAMHDTAGFHPGVTQALNEILEDGKWRMSETVDAITVLERVTSDVA